MIGKPQIRCVTMLSMARSIRNERWDLSEETEAFTSLAALA